MAHEDPRLPSQLLVQRGRGALHGPDDDKIRPMDHHPDDSPDSLARSLILQPTTPEAKARILPHGAPFLPRTLRIFTLRADQPFTSKRLGVSWESFVLARFHRANPNPHRNKKAATDAGTSRPVGSRP